MRLVSDDFSTRKTAADVLRAMWMGVPAPDTPLEKLDPVPDMVGQADRFKQRVAETVSDPRFPTHGFVCKVCDHMIARADEWTLYCDRRWQLQKNDDRQFDRISKRIGDLITSTTNQSEIDRYEKRLARVLEASIERDCKRDAAIQPPAESQTETGLMTNIVFSSLTDAILVAPDALRRLLAHPREARYAFEALERIGPRGIAFARHLFDVMDRADSDEYSSDADLAARALGSIGNDNAEIVSELVQRLKSTSSRTAILAARVLSRMGTNVAGKTQSIIPLLSSMVDRDEQLWLTIEALASVGRHDRSARAKVIDLARPRPAEWAVVPDWPDQRYDKVLPVRGAALNAMRHFVDYPDECVPVLLAAINDFEEFDPDECYAGPAGRVSSVLKVFGRSASEAALPLANRIGESADFPQAILDALASMKGGAVEALPTLHAFRAKQYDGDAMPDLSDASDVDLDTVGRVIRVITADWQGHR